jgi:hypothetical protein
LHSKVFRGDIIIFVVVRKVPYFVVDVGACRGGIEELELGEVQAQDSDDIRADSGGSGSCEGRDRDRRVVQILSEPAQFLIGWTEVMAPFADTMGFIDGNAGQLALPVDNGKVATEAVRLA